MGLGLRWVVGKNWGERGEAKDEGEKGGGGVGRGGRGLGRRPHQGLVWSWGVPGQTEPLHFVQEPVKPRRPLREWKEKSVRKRQFLQKNRV